MPPNNILEQGTKTKRFFDRLPDNTWIPRKSKERRVMIDFNSLFQIKYRLIFSIEHQVHVNYMIYLVLMSVVQVAVDQANLIIP